MANIEEWLANHENRLSEIEGLFPTLLAEDCRQIVKEVLAEILVKPEEWTTKQWDIVNQLRGEMINLKKKFIEYLAKKKQGDRL